MSKTIGHIDLTPTWSGIVPIIQMGLENGNFEGKRNALIELKRMAALADKYVALQKKGDTNG